METKDNIELPPLHYDELPEHTQKGDMRLKDGKLWMCSDPDINRWVCPDDRGWQLVPKIPTKEMLLAGKHTIKGADTTFEGILAEYAYLSMLAAAPKFGEEE